MADKRAERMMEEVLKLPGNDNCADCHAPAPRWASVNLGIFLCVNCASVHRKLGTHKSRVKSVTLDTWSRDQITAMRTIGNKASNAIYNPNERLHPPPTSSTAEARDSEIERYIRKKYEVGAFKSPSSAKLPPQPTPVNVTKERNGRLAPSIDPWNLKVSRVNSQGEMIGENKRNPELNDVIVRSPVPRKERDLPPLPTGNSISPRPISASLGTGASARPRPARSPSTNTMNLGGQMSDVGVGSSGGSKKEEGLLVDLNGGTSSTLPLQLNNFGTQPQQTQQSMVQGGMHYGMGFQPQAPFQGGQQHFQGSQQFSQGYPPSNQPYLGQMSVEGGMNVMAGSSGSNISNGFNNMNGFNGMNGTNGFPGPHGMNGTGMGMNGMNGMNGGGMGMSAGGMGMNGMNAGGIGMNGGGMGGGFNGYLNPNNVNQSTYPSHNPYLQSNAQGAYQLPSQYPPSNAQGTYQLPSQFPQLSTNVNMGMGMVSGFPNMMR
ncbi:hypothetical protein M231_00939 [Tremella mesenterica]|uniref:Arf-GAP domain-containing protein n=1 Tax=Tremella mesenterica TaxID=5217 RepID=A0A4Q1BUB8_TREME|nr:hypothetical protein M231_00939 [Tremella mesenterica]